MDYREAADQVAALSDPNDPTGSIIAVQGLFAANPELFEAYAAGEVGNPVTVRTGVSGDQMANDMLAAVPQRQQKYVDGIQNPRANPQQAAIAAGGAWTQGVQAAIQRGAYVAGVRGYNLDEAIATAVADGGAAWAAGIQKRGDKIRRAMNVVARDLTAVASQVRAMPKDTLQQRVARSAAMQTGMNAAKLARTGGTAPRA